MCRLKLSSTGESCGLCFKNFFKSSKRNANRARGISESDIFKADVAGNVLPASQNHRIKHALPVRGAYSCRPVASGIAGLRSNSSKRLVLAPAPCHSHHPRERQSNGRKRAFRSSDQNEATPLMDRATYAVYSRKALRSPIEIRPAPVSCNTVKDRL